MESIKTINGNWNSTAGKYKVHVDGYTWYVNTVAEIQARVDQFRSRIVGKTLTIWENGKLVREQKVSA